MKKLISLLTLCLLTPLTALAHPGHDELVANRWLDFITQDSFVLFALVLLGLLYQLLRLSLIRTPRSGKYSAKSDRMR